MIYLVHISLAEVMKFTEPMLALMSPGWTLRKGMRVLGEAVWKIWNENRAMEEIWELKEMLKGSGIKNVCGGE